MMGAIAGDIIGSAFEAPDQLIKSKQFELFTDKSHFTDDTVLTVAVADSLLSNVPYGPAIHRYINAYQDAGFSKGMLEWGARPKPVLRDSAGNGSAMRVSAIGWWFDSMKEVIKQAHQSAVPTHAHEDAVKGAQCVAASVLLARMGKGKKMIRDFVQKEFRYDLSKTLFDIRPDYEPRMACVESVPQAMIAFLESRDFEDAVRNAVSLGGRSDTLACMAGACMAAISVSKTMWWLLAKALSMAGANGYDSCLRTWRERKR